MKEKSRENVYEQLKIDEGVEYKVYLDHLGYKTCGVGHLCVEGDPEMDLGLGAPVSEHRVKELFESDLDTAISECVVLFGQGAWEGFPEEVKEICVNMMFNMGRPRYSGFKKHLAALWAGDWAEAGRQARDSRWHGQVGDRAERLCLRLEEIDGE